MSVYVDPVMEHGGSNTNAANIGSGVPERVFVLNPLDPDTDTIICASGGLPVAYPFCRFSV
jgi:hypothetical protein